MWNVGVWWRYWNAGIRDAVPGGVRRYSAIEGETLDEALDAAINLVKLDHPDAIQFVTEPSRPYNLNNRKE